MPRASVIIPTYDGIELLAGALASLEHQTFRDFETVVVDNGSKDGTVELLERAHPDVRLVRFAENRGFAAAVNAGIRAARGDVIALLNNDAEADPHWLAALVGTLDREPQVGSCASKMLMHGDRTRIDSAGDQFGILAWSIGHGAPDGPCFAEPRNVLSACAGAAAYRRETLEQVGGFDESFFAYLEDVDLGIRIRLAGWRCLYVPEAVVYHRGSATAGRAPATKLSLLMRNSLVLFFRYAPPGRLLLWTPALLVWPFVRARRERQPLHLAAGAVRFLLRGVPGILRHRRAVARSRRISGAEFRACLASPWARPAPPSNRAGKRVDPGEPTR